MKKLFISHSGSDKEIVDQFVEHILKLGLGFSPEDIAYTSNEDTGVGIGKSIQAFIKENIISSDFVIFMISENYKKSEICLNEMGAAWATEKIVLPLIFPNLSFNSIGWLYNFHRGIKLNDSFALDSLYESISEKYNLKLKISTWNRHKGDFIQFLNKKTGTICDAKSELITEEEYDLLTCREIFEENVRLNNESLRTITKALEISAERMDKGVRQINNITQNKNSSPTQARPILQRMAHENNELAEVYEREMLLMKSYFDKAMNIAIKIREMAPLEESQRDSERKEMASLIEAMRSFMSETVSGRDALKDDIYNLDNTYTKSKQRLIKCFSEMVTTLRGCIKKAEEVLIYT